MAHFGAQTPNGLAVQQLEVLVRTAIFKPANALVQWLLQQAADRIDAAYQPAPGSSAKDESACGWTVCLAPSHWSATTTTMRAKNRGTIQPMRHWAWRLATRPLWPG